MRKHGSRLHRNFLSGKATGAVYIGFILVFFMTFGVLVSIVEIAHLAWSRSSIQSALRESVRNIQMDNRFRTNVYTADQSAQATIAPIQAALEELSTSFSTHPLIPQSRGVTIGDVSYSPSATSFTGKVAYLAPGMSAMIKIGTSPAQPVHHFICCDPAFSGCTGEKARNHPNNRCFGKSSEQLVGVFPTMVISRFELKTLLMGTLKSEVKSAGYPRVKLSSIIPNPPCPRCVFRNNQFYTRTYATPNPTDCNVGYTEAACGISNMCTTYGCSAGSCTVTNLNCPADSNLCTQEVCNPSVGCESIPSVTCAVASECNASSCNTTTGQCDNTPINNGGACANESNDPNNCTQNICSGGVCTHPDIPNRSTTPQCCSSPPAPVAQCIVEGGVHKIEAQTTWNAAQCKYNTTITSCDDNNPCTVDTCDTTSGTAQCRYSNVAAGGGLGCTPASGSDANSCLTSACNGGGQCINDYMPTNEGLVCADLGAPASCQTNICEVGQCTRKNLANGTSCVSDNNQCTSDVCSEGVCAHNAVTDGTTCTPATNDSDVCSNPGCVAGACVANAPMNKEPVGSHVGCQPDNNPSDCTLAACSSSGTCQQGQVPDPANAGTSACTPNCLPKPQVCCWLDDQVGSSTNNYVFCNSGSTWASDDKETTPDEIPRCRTGTGTQRNNCLKSSLASDICETLTGSTSKVSADVTASCGSSPPGSGAVGFECSKYPSSNPSSCSCGDGVLDTGEQCEGIIYRDPCPDGSSCSCSNCIRTVTTPQCGNGVVEEDRGEECDGSALNEAFRQRAEITSDPFFTPYTQNTWRCTACKVEFCGDGVVNNGEQCDVGDTETVIPDGKRCLPSCEVGCASDANCAALGSPAGPLPAGANPACVERRCNFTTGQCYFGPTAGATACTPSSGTNTSVLPSASCDYVSFWCSKTSFACEASSESTTDNPNCCTAGTTRLCPGYRYEDPSAPELGVGCHWVQECRCDPHTRDCMWPTNDRDCIPLHAQCPNGDPPKIPTDDSDPDPTPTPDPPPTCPDGRSPITSLDPRCCTRTALTCSHLPTTCLYTVNCSPNVVEVYKEGDCELCAGVKASEIIVGPQCSGYGCPDGSVSCCPFEDESECNVRIYGAGSRNGCQIKGFGQISTVCAADTASINSFADWCSQTIQGNYPYPTGGGSCSARDRSIAYPGLPDHPYSSELCSPSDDATEEGRLSCQVVNPVGCT